MAHPSRLMKCVSAFSHWKCLGHERVGNTSAMTPTGVHTTGGEHAEGSSG